MEKRFQQLFQKFGALKIGVIGDVMLDSYVWGNVERISPEAPVPIVSLHKKEQRIGGAGNVALNLQSLGVNAFVLSVMGNDDDARCLLELFNRNDINTSYCINSENRITTSKTRIISRNQHMMRLDAEITKDLGPEDEQRMITLVKEFITKERPDVIILEDYNKGVLTAEVIRNVIAACKEAGVITAVDPKRQNFFEYREVDIFKPNLKEVKDALNLLFNDVSLHLLQDIHEQLFKSLEHHISLITLSEKGVFYAENDQAAIIPSHIRNIADVSGAGDTVIAVASAVYAVTRDIRLMAEIANLAGGIVCEEVGTVAISRDKLLHECELLLA